MAHAATVTLPEFLLARIAEDEERARRVGTVDHPLSQADYFRVLADCEAKRRIVDLHGPARPACEDGYRAGSTHDDVLWAGTVDGRPTREGHCPTLRALALPYADHPDYREEWTP